MLAVSSQLISVITVSARRPGPGAPGPASRRTAATATLTGPLIGFSLAQTLGPDPRRRWWQRIRRDTARDSPRPPSRPAVATAAASVRTVDEQIYLGNATVDAPADRGWLLGHFKPVTDPRHSEDVEIKWGIYAPGDRRAQWVTGEKRTAVLI